MRRSKYAEELCTDSMTNSEMLPMVPTAQYLGSVPTTQIRSKRSQREANQVPMINTMMLMTIMMTLSTWEGQ